MKKFYVSKKDLNDEELRTGRVSYGRIISRYINNLVLCNNIPNIDEGIWDNMNYEEKYKNAEYGIDEDFEIYQYYLCDLDEYVKNILIDWGFIFSYSDVLELDVLMVDHWGTSWDYVMTDVEWSEDYEECK